MTNSQKMPWTAFTILAMFFEEGYVFYGKSVLLFDKKYEAD